MLSKQPKKHTDHSDYNFSLKVIITLVALEVIILVCISFVKIYIDKKHNVLDKMRDEVEMVEKDFVDNTNYSEFVMRNISDAIKYNYESPKKIENIISHYPLKQFFGWKGFFWLNKEHIVTNVNGGGNIFLHSNLSYLSNVRLSKIMPNRIFYSPNPDMSERLTSYLDITLGVENKGEYIGSLVLQMDISSIITNLERYRRNNKTDFAIIDSRMNILMTYPLNRTNLGVKGKIITKQNLLKALTNINFFSKHEKEVSNIDVFTGSNFLAKKIKNKPYLILVSQDPDFVQATFTKKIALKFLEIIVLASFFLAIVLMVYKRETWLRAKAEKASNIATKAMHAKSDFLSYTAHEVRSPLGFILTGSEIMQKKLFGHMPEKYEQYVDGIHHNANLILDFINDILDERHIVSGNFKLDETYCNLEDIISKAVLTNKTRFHNREIEITTNISSNIPYVFGDQRKLLQMISNLLSNAYKYSLDNTKINISVKKHLKKLKVIIADEGIGMTDEEVKIALTKYGIAHDKKVDNVIDSYGLGLHIVAMLVKAHNATLDIKSEVSKGTKVTITFPQTRIINKINNKDE